MPELHDRMVKAHQRRRLFARANEAYASLQADAIAWDAELAERHAWDVTLGDGLGEEIIASPRQASSTVKKVPG